MGLSVRVPSKSSSTVSFSALMPDPSMLAAFSHAPGMMPAYILCSHRHAVQIAAAASTLPSSSFAETPVAEAPGGLPSKVVVQCRQQIAQQLQLLVQHFAAKLVAALQGLSIPRGKRLSKHMEHFCAAEACSCRRGCGMLAVAFCEARA